MTSDDEECAPLAVPLTTVGHEIEQNQPVFVPKICHDEVADPVPVLLLTGYLGAGKTTLVNHILTAKHGYRCAVLLNEIGDTADVEKALVKEPEVCLMRLFCARMWSIKIAFVVHGYRSPLLHHLCRAEKPLL